MANIGGPDRNNLREDLARLKTRYLQREERTRVNGLPGVSRLSALVQILRRLMSMVLAVVLLYGCVLGALLLGKLLLRRFLEWWALIQ